jgi:hypothetical protein
VELCFLPFSLGAASTRAAFVDFTTLYALLVMFRLVSLSLSTHFGWLFVFAFLIIANLYPAVTTPGFDSFPLACLLKLA